MKKTLLAILIAILFFSLNVHAQGITRQRKAMSKAGNVPSSASPSLTAESAGTMSRVDNVPSFASMVAEGEYFIKVNETGKYLAVEGGSADNGARIVQWDFADQTNHKFIISRSADGNYLIKAVHSNRYLNVAGQSLDDGAVLIQWDFVEQDNLKWSFYFDSDTRTYLIRSKQSGKELKLLGSNTNNDNGGLLTINGNAGKQTYTLQPVGEIKNTFTNTNRAKPMQSKRVLNGGNSAITLRLADGTSVQRYINPGGPQRMIKGDYKKEIISVQNGETCETKTARIDMETKDFVPVTASRYLAYNAPGLIYDVRRFYSGDYTNRQEFPNGENRNPITIATTVRNTSRKITETVDVPSNNSINQAIANLQSGYSLDPLQTTNQSMIYRSSFVQSNTEMQLKIGASGHYMMASFKADMSMSNAKETKTFYIEAEKELFTLSTDKPQAGFFNTDVANIDDLGYISSVTYGIKIIGKIEVENSEESLGGSFSGMVNAGFAGAGFDFGAFSRESHKKVKCFFYVVGGRNETITGVDLADVYYKINQILAGVNYKTCMPIRLEFRSLTTGSPITFKDVTNNFVYDVCTPKAIQDANKDLSIKIQSLMPIGTDIEMYGDIWAEVWSPAHGDLKRYRTTNNLLFSVKKDVHLEMDQLVRYSEGLPAIKYLNIPPQFLEDAEIHIYYNVIDYNTVGEDDKLKLRGGEAFVVKYLNLPGGNIPTEAYYRSVIRVKDLDPTTKPLFYDLVDGDGVTIGISCQVGGLMPKK
jgi:hypothetical protein